MSDRLTPPPGPSAVREAVRAHPPDRTGSRQPAGRPPIPALTGLRLLAAGWVVLFHFQWDLLTLAPGLAPLRPVLSAGYLGVDIFFALSGFVLAYNYGHRLTRWDWSRHGAFIRNRVARVWPVHLVTLHLDLLQAAAAGALGVTEGGHRRTVPAYLQHLTMTHHWWSDRPSFNAPAWSISAEWFAYLTCPPLFLALRRIHRPATAALAAIACYAVMLTVFAGWALPNGNVAHGGMLRLAAEFLAGVLLVRVYRPGRCWLGRCTVPLGLAVLAVVAVVPVGRAGYWLAPALGLFVLCLALDDGPLARLLSTRVFCYGGEISYSLYMTHVLAKPLLHRLVLPSDVDQAGWPVRHGVLVLYAVLLLAAAAGLYHLVEVPSRRLLRARAPALSS